MIDPFTVLGPVALLVICTAVGIALNALVLHMKQQTMTDQWKTAYMDMQNKLAAERLRMDDLRVKINDALDFEENNAEDNEVMMTIHDRIRELLK
jgi:cell division protein FtsL